MKHFLRWVSPLILGVIEFYFLTVSYTHLTLPTKA